MMRRVCLREIGVGLSLLLFIGCQPTAPSRSDKTTPVKATANVSPPVEPIGFWDDYPDVPKFGIMQEIDGVDIPRIKTEQQSLQLAGEIPVDVGNPRAVTASEPTTGDAIVVRMASEPKSLNPITETSAVQTYIMSYVNESLARQNPETFEYEPHLAQRWVTEDSIKLSPDTPGKERRVKLADGVAAAQLEIEYTAPPPPEGDAPPAAPPVISVTTTDKDGTPLAGVWVGVYPKEKILGASATGYHVWSNDKGIAELGGYPTGKYVVKVGAEIYGKSEKLSDGSLVVKPESEENLLFAELKASGESALTLKPDQWIERHEQTYFTYYLKSEVTWSDGTPFTTKDIEFVYALLNNSAVDADALRGYYQDLIECSALSPQVVRMRYRQQYFKAFEFTQAIAGVAPPWHLFANLVNASGKELTLDRLTKDEEAAQNKVSAHGDEFGKLFNLNEEYRRAPMGTGPYVVSRWERDERVELSRNPNYWTKERAGYLDKIIFRFIIDDNGVIPALQTGEIDFAFSLSPEQFFEVLKGPPAWLAKDFVKAEWFIPAFGYVGWNELRPQFQDRRVRVALGLMFDKPRFLESKLYNAGIIVSGPAYYFGPGYDHEVAPLAYAPETARDLLTEAGWFDSDNDGILDKDGVKFSINALIPKGRQTTEDRMAVLKNDLKAVGIEMDIRQLEWASFIELIQARDFDVVTLSWAMAVENDPYQIWHGSGAGKKSRGSNHVSFNNPQANEVIEMLRVTLDEKKRQRIAFSLHRLIDAEQPYQFLYAPKDLGAYHQRFRGVKWYRLRPGFDLTEWFVPKDEQLRTGT